MDNIMIFEKEEFGSIRTTSINGQILFCGKDVATALGYANTKDAISKHCKWVVKCDLPHPQSETKTIEMSFIPEGDVYRLIARSKLESAQKFESWVFDEVLPSLRKAGAYTVQQPFQKTEKELELLEKQLEVEDKKARTASANLLHELANEYGGASNNYKQILDAYASKELSGEFLLPLPPTKKTYSAEDIGRELGITSQKVGRIANHYGLKTDKYGQYAKDKSRTSDVEVEVFRYYEEVIPLIAEHKDEKISSKK